MKDLKKFAREICEHALVDCSVVQAFSRTLHTEINETGAHLLLKNHAPIPLNRLNRVRVVAAGKAASQMFDALLPYLPLPPTCDLQGVLIAPQRPKHLPSSVHFFAGGHPVPNQASFEGAEEALNILQDTQNAPADDALCIFLISGGASTMMELPLDPSISLAETVEFHQALVASGATIVEMNCVRKHFSAIKGGRLARAAGSARKISLLVSDVPPEHLDALASGPTIPDPTTVAQCHEIIERYSLLDSFPPHVRSFFTYSPLPETPKPGEFLSPSWKLLDRDELGSAAQRYAESLGFHTIIDNTCDDWPYNEAADYLVKRLRELRAQHPRVCLISCGEVTVKVPASLVTEVHAGSHRKHATGGRNQHFVLYAATLVVPSDGPVAILSMGSDGIDGNSAAAGAVIDEHTLEDHAITPAPRSRRATAQHALETFDSSSWLTSAGATIVTGPTGQNLRDLRILLAGPPPSSEASGVTAAARPDHPL